MKKLEIMKLLMKKKGVNNGKFAWLMNVSYPTMAKLLRDPGRMTAEQRIISSEALGISLEEMDDIANGVIKLDSEINQKSTI